MRGLTVLPSNKKQNYQIDAIALTLTIKTTKVTYWQFISVIGKGCLSKDF